MFSSIFTIIELILNALGLWNQFLDYVDKKYAADLELRRQAREAAVDKSKVDNDDDSIFKDQDTIVRNLP